MKVIPPVAFSDTLGTFARASSATYTDKTGALVSASANVPRLNYDPVTLMPLGMMLEGAATNLLLNSLLNGTSLSTQSVTVAATAYTLSFYGSGTITLSGAAVAVVAGSGAYPARKTYTFTPTAGSLTLTVSGTVRYAQLETGSAATSFIPTSGAAATRAAESVTATAPAVIYSDVPESDGTGPWNSATTYNVGDIAIIAATHTKYQARTSNTNKPPATNPTDWASIGPTNRWAMVDLETNSQTSQAGQIRFVCKPGGIDAIGLTGLEGSRLDIAMTVDGQTVFSSQKSLDGSIVLDWYDYFFAPFDFLSQSIDLNVPNFANGVVSIEITGASAKCGAVAIGKALEIGGLQYGAQSKIADYSVVTRDEFGAATLVKRKAVPTIEGQVSIEKSRSRAVRSMLRDLRATPALWVGVEEDDDEYFELVTTLGIIRDWAIQIEYVDGVVLGFEIEEL